MSQSYHLITKNSVTVFHDGISKTVYQSDPAFVTVKSHVFVGEYDEALAAADVETAVNDHFAKTSEGYEVKGGSVYYNGIQLRSDLNDRVLTMVTQGHNMSTMTNFLDRLTQNPSSRVQEQLYTFLRVNDLPMMEDGRVMMFKRIRKDWMDCYSGTINNSIGNTISVKRHEVDDDPQRTCSHGLHVCSIEYLAHFWGDRLIGVAVDPADVVAIPYDYNNSKVRVCKYQVVNELPIEVCQTQVSPWRSSVVDDDGYDPDDVEVEEEEDEEYEDDYVEEEEDDEEELVTADTAPLTAFMSSPPKPTTLMGKLRAWVR